MSMLLEGSAEDIKNFLLVVNNQHSLRLTHNFLPGTVTKDEIVATYASVDVKSYFSGGCV
jgi:hypothetical protein